MCLSRNDLSVWKSRNFTFFTSELIKPDTNPYCLKKKNITPFIHFSDTVHHLSMRAWHGCIRYSEKDEQQSFPSFFHFIEYVESDPQQLFVSEHRKSCDRSVDVSEKYDIRFNSICLSSIRNGFYHPFFRTKRMVLWIKVCFPT